MRVRRVTLAAHVPDVRAGAAFYTGLLGFRPIVVEDYVEDYVAKLVQPDTDVELALLPGETAAGVVLALEVADVHAEARRLAEAGAPVGQVQDEAWGERLCQVRDPNGLTVQLVQWLGDRPN